jgi:hypothetical protein
MKTFVALSMVKALLTGRPLFGNPAFNVPEPAEKVLYLIPESSLRPFRMQLKSMRLPYQGKSLFVRTVDVDDNQLRLDNEVLLGGIDDSYVSLDTMSRFMLGERERPQRRTAAVYAGIGSACCTTEQRQSSAFTML